MNCVTVRDETEWVELIEYGFNQLVGSDEEKISRAMTVIKDKMNWNTKLYGDGICDRKYLTYKSINYKMKIDWHKGFTKT